MDFHKKIDRLTHPQASLISEWCWRYFDFVLDDNLIELMSASTDAGFVERIRKSLPSIKENNQMAICLALSFSHPDLSIKQLDKIGLMLELTGHNKYKMAIFSGNLPYLKHLEHDYKKVDAPKNVEKFIDAAASNQLNILQYLAKKQAKKRLQEIIADNNFLVFKTAAANGHLEVLRYIAALVPGTLQKEFAASHSHTLYLAIVNGHLDVLRYLVEQTPGLLEFVLNEGDTACLGIFMAVAKNGHLDVLRYLVEQEPSALRSMIAAENVVVFVDAARNGHLDLLRYLVEQVVELAPEKLKNMIASANFALFRWAAAHPSLDVLRYLAELAPEKLDDMLAAEDFQTFRVAVNVGHRPVINYLLSHPSVFAYAEQHKKEYGNDIALFLTETYASLPSETPAQRSPRLFSPRVGVSAEAGPAEPSPESAALKCNN